LLVQHARRKAGPNVDNALNTAAEDELRKFVLRFGGNEAKADEELARLGMDRESYKEVRKKRLLVDWYLQSQLTDTRPVTYRELMDTYNEMKDKYFARDARITFRIIDIQPDKIQAPAPMRDSGQFAEELANRLVGRIRSGEDFGELAKQHSHGHRKAFGGLWQPVQPESLAAPYNVLAAEADKIEPGQIAGPIVVAGRVFIMKLEEKQTAGYAPFEDADVQRLVERKALLDRQNSAQGRLKATLREEARLGKADEFVDFCLEKIYTMSRQPQPDAAGRAEDK
jgi:parvulin-like peptidyl-prolyl isomerase